MGIVFITHEDVKSLSSRTQPRLLVGDNPWRILSPPKEGTNMGFGLQLHGMYQNQTNTMPDVIDHHGNKQAITPSSNFLDTEMNNSMVDARTTSGSVCPEPTGKPPSKLTWKDLSPTKQRNLSQNSSSGGSSGDENPTGGVIWGEGSEVNKNQLVTWKQLSPTKLSPPADCEPDSGYSSNEVNLKTKEASEGSNSFITASQKPMKTSSGSTSNESPEDALEYFYDEDFSVQFEPNLSNPPMDIGDIGRDEMFILPQMLNGSYLSFESLKSSSDANPTPFEDQCELEFSDNQNSMEISTSERDMLCSSEMLELSSDPLFTPTPTSEAPPCHLLNDSLDRAVRNPEVQGSKTSVDALHSDDGQLAMDCHLRKENYCLSFVGSQSKNSNSDVDISVAASQGPESDDSDGGTNPSSASSAEEAEEVCSNSFHFCRHEDVPSNYSTALRVMRTEHGAKSRLVGRLSSLPEQPQEIDQESTSSGMSECSSQGRITSHSLPRNSCSFQTFSSLKNKVNLSERPKTMVSWKQIKNMYRKGKQMPKPTDINGKSSSMPDLCLHTWQKVAAERKKELESSEEEKGENKRYSATLVEMYQRMKAMGKALSPDIHIPGWSPNSSLSSRPGSGHWSVNSDDKGYNNSAKSHEDGFSPICFEKTVWDTSNSHYHTVTAVNLQENAGQRDLYNNSFELRSTCYQTPVNFKRSQATAISPQSVNIWLGTKNFSAQFPPLTGDCGVQTSFDDECSMASGLRRNCKPRVPDANYLPRCHCHMMDNNEKKTENFRMPGRFAREVFYSHRSLPDLSFLTLPSPNIQGLRRHSLEKQVFINPRLHRTSSNNEEKETLQELKKLQRPEAMHISGPFCSRRPVMFRPIGGSRGADWHSSSSGLSTSSTSSGIDPGYLDYRYGNFGSMSNLPCCAAFLDTRYVYNSAGFETLPRLIRQQEEEPQRKGRILERRYERYQYESHPAHARQKPWKKWSAGSSSTSSGTSVQTETLYSVAEEKTPTSPEKSMEEDIENGEEFGKCQGENYYDNQIFDDKSQLEAAVQRVRMRNTGLTLAETYCPDKRPLKSCLRKRQRSLSDPYGQSGWADNKSCTVAARQHRHSYGCDRDRMAGADGPEDSREAFDAIAASPDEISPSNCIGSGSAVAISPMYGSNNVSWSEKDMARSKKSVSFAREVSFHSPPCSPQVSPRRQPLQGRQVPHGGCNSVPSAGYWMNNMAAQPAFPVPRGLQSQDEDLSQRTLEEDQRSHEEDQPSLPQRTMEKKRALEKKSAMLAEVSKAAEALVAHFSKSKDPFDKLRLGSSIETPEIGELVLSQLCSAVAQVINDGLKPYESGLHVFGRVHITVWRVAEASAEPGPSTRAICDIVKELKNRPTLVSNKHRFDAFIFALLNSRLLDFWLGYLRHKDNLICHFYKAGALLQQLYISDLENAYEEMLLSLQPLSVLPFQLDLDFVSGNSCHEPPNGEFLRLQDTTTSLPDLRAGVPIHGSPKFSLSSVRYEEPTEENALGHSAAKAWKWLSNSTASALPIAKSVMANVAQKVTPSISKLSSSMNRATLGDPAETKVTDNLNMDEVLLQVLDTCHDEEDESLSSADNSTLQGSSVKSFTVEDLKSAENIEEKEMSNSLPRVEKDRQKMECKNAMIDSKSLEKQKESLLDELFPDANSMENLQQQGRPLTMSNLAHKFLGIGTGKRKQAYRKGVTEYSFDSESEPVQRRSQNVSSEKDDSSSRQKENSDKASESLVSEVLDRYAEKSAKTEVFEKELVQSNASNTNSNSAGHAVSGSSKSSLTKLETPPNTFDIIKLFDKLLLPNKPSQTLENRPSGMADTTLERNGPNKSAFKLFSWKPHSLISQNSKSLTHELCKVTESKSLVNKDQNAQDEVLKSDEEENSQELEETMESSPTMLYNWYTMEEPRDVYHDSTDDEHSPHLSESVESSLNYSNPQDQFRMPDYRH